jgi:hypothetical protein
VIGLAGLVLLLQVANPAAPTFPVQLGVSVTSDTVTVGERFIAILRVRAPIGASIRFPTESDSASSSAVTGTQLIGKPAIDSTVDSTSITMSAAYRLAAWDIGPQRLGLPDIAVTYRGKTGYVSVADRGVFVRSVLPDDSTLRVPKPPRPAIEITPFNWLPWLLALAALVAAGLAWRLWIWYRNRRNAPLDPFSAAQRDFARVEAMQLLQAGDTGRHAALMTDVMREYLAARVPEIERSHTSSELLSAGGRIHGVAGGLGELLWRADLIKFARAGITRDEAEEIAAKARGAVQAVEDHFVGEERKKDETRDAA